VTDLGELTGESLTIEVGTESGAVVLALAGELDLATTPRLAAALAEDAVAGAARVVLDLGRLSFMDSTGLGLIVRADRELRDGGRALVLRNLQAQVSRLLQLSGTLDRLTVES
jgi:anti-sigma B factor antagonist